MTGHNTFSGQETTKTNCREDARSQQIGDYETLNGQNHTSSASVSEVTNTGAASTANFNGTGNTTGRDLEDA